MELNKRSFSASQVWISGSWSPGFKVSRQGNRAAVPGSVVS